jgi:hypothetical protein
MTKIDDSKLQMLGKVRRIVTHGGLPHMDDIMACAIAYALGVPHDAVIERRNPKPGELESMTVLVLDVGGTHDPEHLDFDHHQRSREEEPKCAFKLFSEWLGVDEEFSMLFPWYATWNLLDVAGPNVTAAALGTTWDRLEGLVANPLADFVIRRFADDPSFRQKIVLTLSNAIDLTRRLWKSINEKVVALEVCGLPAGDFTACATEEISRCSDIWIRLNRPALIISKDNRGEGLTILRCNDDPRLDFSRCVGRPYAVFCHPGGFLVKTRNRGDDPNAIVRDALVER